MNKVSVNICGKDYTITGEKDPKHIEKLAAYVDSMMEEILKDAPRVAMSSVAVLSALNVADQYFSMKENNEDLEDMNVQLENDSRHYAQLWEEAKKSFLNNKKESQDIIDSLKGEKGRLENDIKFLEKELEELMEGRDEIEKRVQQSSHAEMRKMEEKYREVENNFFDIQMENIQLKSEIEKLKSRDSWKKNEREGY